MGQATNEGPFFWRRWKRLSRATLVTFAILAVLLLAARLALPLVLRVAFNSRLDKIPDYTGSVERVEVALWRGAYTLNGLVIRKRTGRISEPYFRAERIDFSVAWRELLRGKFVGDVTMEKPMLTLIAGPSSDVTQLAADHRWQEAINDIFPIDITWLRINEGQLRFINHSTKPRVDLRVAHVRGLATGMRHRAQEERNEFPATISLAGETMGGGGLKIIVQLEPLAIDPHFLLKLELEKVSLPAMNEFLRAYGGFDVSQGAFSCYLEVVVRNGHFAGYVKPFFDQVVFSQVPGDPSSLKQEVWEWFVSTTAWVLKNHSSDEVATRIPISGEFKDLDVHFWQSLRSLVGHAFVHPLQPKLDSKSPGGAGDRAEPGTLPEKKPVVKDEKPGAGKLK